MSKYRIDIQPSRFKVGLYGVFWAVLLISIFSWQAEVLFYQLPLQILLAAILTILAIRYYIHSKNEQAKSITLSELSEWEYHSSSDMAAWRISAKSRVTPYLIWIHLRSASHPMHAKWEVIFKDQVSDDNYRRLCRAVYFRLQHNNT